ncbi:hypothetical protein KCU65_g4223, partial [Aureobasidium melanogenum]
MKSFAIAAAFAGAAVALPQGVTQAISPKSGPPSGCSLNHASPFSISITNVTTNGKRDLEARKVLTITLKNGTLTDDEGRTGYIAANNQFQFDKPAQTGAIYTSGFSVCANGTLAIGDSAIFYQCLSGDFYNLYDESTGDQCSPIYINVLDTGAAASSGAATQIGDGQLQAATSTAAPVSQISDGQIQASTGAVTQISDGQIQAPTSTAAPVTQISDGQIQAPTGKTVTQISDGQIQAPTTAAGKTVTQISDGQIQAPTSSAGKTVTQISDGQIQAPTGGATKAANGTVVAGAATASSSIAAYTGAAAVPTFAGEMLIAAGALAVAFL